MKAKHLINFMLPPLIGATYISSKFNSKILFAALIIASILFSAVTYLKIYLEKEEYKTKKEYENSRDIYIGFWEEYLELKKPDKGTQLSKELEGLNDNQNNNTVI